MKKLDDIWGYVFGFAFGSCMFFIMGLSPGCTMIGKEPWRAYTLVTLGALCTIATIASSFIAFRKLRH